MLPWEHSLDFSGEAYNDLTMNNSISGWSISAYVINGIKDFFNAKYPK